MIPYADFNYFGVLLLYVVIPTLLLGVLARAGWRWALLLTFVAVGLQYQNRITIRPEIEVREFWIVGAFAVWQCILIRIYATMRPDRGPLFYSAICGGLVPLLLAKAPSFAHLHQFGFIGISYVTFRALDILFCLRDEAIATPSIAQLFGYLFFFPTLSAGPIDRYRRFEKDWQRHRSRADFLFDLDLAIQRVARGFLYKFIIAALIRQYWLEPAEATEGIGAMLSYMYAYSLYLFFDFAGYSAFAIGFSYLLGIHTPENFDRPFLARNIRDFWNRWHITLSFWFRDHVYMRFLLTARRMHWSANKHALAVAGYFLSFALMGLWHGIRLHFLLYGLYHAGLLSAFHLFSQRKTRSPDRSTNFLGRGISVFVTFNFVCFGFLVFSGHLGAHIPHYAGALDFADCEEISGWAWDRSAPDAALEVELLDSGDRVTTVLAHEFRPELRASGIGNGHHAFRISTPLQLRDGHRHFLTLRIGHGRKMVTPTATEVACPGQNLP